MTAPTHRCCVGDVVLCCASDELIRQVTINCAERGLLLLRVRDEIRMAIASYQTLYESSIAFGMRKALQAEQHKIDLETKVSTHYRWHYRYHYRDWCCGNTDSGAVGC